MGFFDKWWDTLLTPDTLWNRARWEKRASGWVICCRRCGWEEPFGRCGVRRKAAGTKYQFWRCPRCKKWSWLAIRKKG